MSRTLVVTDARGTRELPLVGSMAVGREPSCEISADDPLLSRRHAEFRAGPTGVTLTDLESRNGIRVNGVTTRQAVLRNGDRIEIGSLRITFQDEAPVSPSGGKKKDATLWMRPSAGSAAPSPAPRAHPAVDEDATILLRPPAARPPAASPKEPVADGDATLLLRAPGEARPAANLAGKVPVADGDATILLRAPVGAPPPVASPIAQAPVTDGDATILLKAPGNAPRVISPAAPVPAVDGDATILLRPPTGSAGAPVASAGAREAVHDDATVLIRPPATPRAAPTARIEPPPAAVDESDGTNASATAPRPAPPTVQPAAPLGPEAAKDQPRAVARRAKTSWATRVVVQVVGLALFAALVVAGSMAFWQSRTLNVMSVARATALVNWLAADASLRAARGELASAADEVGREPGVASALVLGLDGNVVSPASRAGEAYKAIPALDAGAADIYRLRTGSTDGVVHVARPVTDRDGKRIAVAWVAFRPSAGPAGSSVLIVLAPALIVVLGVAFLVASSIRRATLGALKLFHEDIELAIGGQLETVSDPLGARPIRDLAETINYLVARARAGGSAAPMSPASQVAARVGPSGREAAPGRSATRATASASSRPEARMVTDATLKVVEANAECTAVLGLSPSTMIGVHLIDALRSQALVDAVFDCLGSLEGAGAERRTVMLGGESVDVAVSRTGKDQPVTIVVARGEPAVHR